MSIYQVAIIGYGMSGRIFHLPPLLKNSSYQVKYILTNNLETRTELKNLYPPIQLVSSLDEVLQDPVIDLVIIATPNNVHYEYTKRILEANKHVVVEKPFTETAKEAQELFELAHKQHKILRVYHNRQYDGDFLTVKELIEQKKMGRIVEFHSRFDRYRPIGKGGWRGQPGVMAGVFYDLAPHLVHQSVTLFGLPDSIFADTRLVRYDSLVDDSFELILYYPNLRVYLGAGILERHPQPKILAVGTSATYESWGFNSPDVVHEPIGQIYQIPSEKSILLVSDRCDEKIIIPYRYGEHYKFYQKLAEDMETLEDNDEDQRTAYRVILVMEKAIQSQKEGRLVFL